MWERLSSREGSAARGWKAAPEMKDSILNWYKFARGVEVRQSQLFDVENLS